MGIETGSPVPGVWAHDDRGREVLKRDATFVAFARTSEDGTSQSEHRQEFVKGAPRTEVEEAMRDAADALVSRVADWGWYVER